MPEYITNSEAVEIVKKHIGRKISSATTYVWFHRYKLGKKIGGIILFDKGKLIQFIEKAKLGE